MDYGGILAKFRKEKGYSQFEVADFINRSCHKPCTNKTVSHWETGLYLPSLEQFLLLCELYGIRDILGTFRGADQEFRGLAKLNALGRGRAEEYIAMLSGNPLFAELEHRGGEGLRHRQIRLYDVPVAAGSGAFLDSDYYEEFEIDETVPAETDFAVRVSGDSMTPRFVDRQIVFIRRQQVLALGDVGIFALDGDAYIKKLGQGELLSLNPRYGPIPIRQYSAFHILGKVVG